MNDTHVSKWLHEASRGNIFAMETLLEQGMDVNVSRPNGSSRKFTALHFASRRGHLKCVKWLLEHGADPQQSAPQYKAYFYGVGEKNSFAISWAAANGHTECVAEILKHLPWTPSDEKPFTEFQWIDRCFYHSSKRKKTDIFTAVLQWRLIPAVENGCLYRELTSMFGFCARICKWVLQECIIFICKMWLNKDKYCLNEYKNSGPFNLQRVTWEYITAHALCYVATIGAVHPVKLLLEVGVPANGNDNKIPLIAMSTGIVVSAEWMEKGSMAEVVRTLVKHGADVNIRDEYGNTPLLAALGHRKSEVLNELLEAGADVNPPDLHPIIGTPLHIAVLSCNPDIVRPLLLRGALVNRLDKDGSTPLFDLLSQNYQRVNLGRPHSPDIVTALLIKAGCDLLTPKKDESHPVLVALENGHFISCKILLKSGIHTGYLNIDISKKSFSEVPENLLKEIQNSINEVHSLKVKCRVVIRSYTSYESVDDLPLPAALIHYLKYVDLDMYLNTT